MVEPIGKFAIADRVGDGVSGEGQLMCCAHRADNGIVATITTPNRRELVRRGQRLEYFTIVYNTLEGLVSIVAGVIAGSISLIGFGLDSLIEVTSGAALLWRFHHDLDHSRREQVERTTLRIVGGCFIALALYILYESGSTLIGHDAPERSIPGIIVAAVSVVVMPLLARAKRRGASGIGSRAMEADSRQTDFCTYVSLSNSLGRVASECRCRVVVGRSGGWTGD